MRQTLVMYADNLLLSAPVHKKIPRTTLCNAWDVNYAVPPCLLSLLSVDLSAYSFSQMPVHPFGLSHRQSHSFAHNAGLRAVLKPLRAGLPRCSHKGTFSTEIFHSRFLSLLRSAQVLVSSTFYLKFSVLPYSTPKNLICKVKIL